MTQPLISVVMPAYNAEKYIRQAISSILEQTYTNLELLIADDASKDNTKEIIESFTDKRIKTFHNKENLGYLKTCNKLMALAQGDYLAFQDADDYSTPNKFELQLQAFENKSDLGAVGCNKTAVDIADNPMFSTNYLLKHDEILNAIPEYFSVIPNSFLFKRDVYEQIGGYHEYFNRMGAEDYYWTFLIMEKFKLINLKEPLYYYRYNPVSITGDRSDNIMKRFSFRIVGFLVNQRRQTGTDALESQNTVPLEEHIALLKKPYTDDPSLFYRELAAKYFYEGLKKRALKLIFKAIRVRPFKVRNYRDLVYFVKKTKS